MSTTPEPSRSAAAEHEDAVAAAVGAHLKAGPVGGERIRPNRPRPRRRRGGQDSPIRSERSRTGLRGEHVPFVIVEHHFEEPFGLVQVWLDEPGNPVAVANALRVPVGRPGPVRLAHLGEVHVGAVLGLALVPHDVPFVVVGLTDEPRVDPRGIPRVGDAGVLGEAVDGRDVLRRDGPPMGDAGRLGRSSVRYGGRHLRRAGGSGEWCSRVPKSHPRAASRQAGLVGMGSVVDAVPFTALTSTFSPRPRTAPPPLGRESEGSAKGLRSTEFPFGGGE